jgi:alpha/beta superfamily hydrolase
MYRVLRMLTETLLERLHYHVLRFNCRGVGKSTGWASLTGLAEGKDLEEVITWALDTIPDVRSVVIIVRNVSWNRLTRSILALMDMSEPGILVRIADCEPSARSTRTSQDATHSGIVPAGSARAADAVSHGHVCDCAEESG